MSPTHRRKKLSGHAYRSKRKERERAEEEILNKIPRLSSFFSKKTQQPSLNSLELSKFEENDIQDISSNPTAPVQAITPADTSFRSCPVREPRQTEEIGVPMSITQDPADWIISEHFRDYVAVNGCNQNKQANFLKSKREYRDGSSRYLSSSLFCRNLQNGEEVDRRWLIYSESKGSVFCAPCLLFGGESAFSNKDGYNDWKNASQRTLEHENSSNHKDCVLSLKERGDFLGRIDHDMTVQLDREILYWKNVLKRVATTVKALAIRGLPFRGHDEKFGSTKNGNYMMLLEYLAEFDPFLAGHIKKFGNKGSGSTSYLSKTICEEFISVMAKRVTSTIINEIKKAKYYSIVIDSTPDIAHIDQVSFIVRYITCAGVPVERFLKFIENPGHKAEDLKNNVVVPTLELFNLNFADMRGQSYDTAANMSGIYNGLRALIQNINHLAEYVPCACHSLNLVGTHAAECCPEAVAFFEMVQNVYNFFAASTQRWKILQSFAKSTGITLKTLSSTRWSARDDAIRVLKSCWDEIIEALLSFEESSSEKPAARNEAKGLRLRLERLESAFMITVWSVLLSRFNVFSKKLQSVNTNISEVIDLYKVLIELVQNTREQFDVYEEEALKISIIEEYETETKRKRKRKIQHDETREGDIDLSGRDKFRVQVFNVILDRMHFELKDKCDGYEKFFEKFSVLAEFTKLDKQGLLEKSEKLQSFYPDDLEVTFGAELCDFQTHCKIKKIEGESPMNLLQFIRKNGFNELYPNVEIAYRLFLTPAVTNCSAERSFSCLKRIKNYLRSKLSETNLNNLAILNIESDVLNSIDMDELINEFAQIKARRKYFV